MFDVDVTVVAVYLALVLAVGLWSGRNTVSINQYAVVNWAFGAWVVFAAMSALFIGGGFSSAQHHW